MRIALASAALLIGIAMPLVGEAQAAPTRLYCANGSVADTTEVTINGRNVSASKYGWSPTGKLATSSDAAIYNLEFNDGAEMAINRATGHAMLSRLPGGPYLLVCRPGGPRL